MKRLRTQHRLQLTAVWLIAAICHHGDLFSQDIPSETAAHAQPELSEAPQNYTSDTTNSAGLSQPVYSTDEIKETSLAQVESISAQKAPAAQSSSNAAPASPLTPSSPAAETQPSAPAPQPPTIITPSTPAPDGTPAQANTGAQPGKEISINFNNVSMIEYIRFISRISNKNFIFDEESLQFNVTIVSEEPTTVENLMAALLQELRIRNLSILEQSNNIIIHHNPRVRSPARVFTDGTVQEMGRESELVTRVFRLNTLDPIKASEIIRPLLSDDALVEVLKDTNNLIITDLVTTVNKIAQLVDTLDAPNSGVTIGQYVVRNAFVDSLVDLGTKILQPIAQGNPFVLVPHSASNSIFIVSNAFIVEKALAILQNLDHNEGKTKILSLEGLQPNYEAIPVDAPRGGPGQGPRGPGNAPFGAEERIGRSPLDEGENGLEGPGSEGAFPPGEQPPEGFRLLPGAIGSEGKTSSIFEEARGFRPGAIGVTSRWSRELPLGHIERTMFFIYKLRYRKGDQIEVALRKIANSLQMTGTANIDLISTINSSQWIESSNSLIFTGPAPALAKIKELILEVDIPLRQVFIEMLILDTTITDSLSYGVDWINRFGGGSTTGEQAFLGNGNTGFINDANVPIQPPPFPIAGGSIGSGTNFLDVGGLGNAFTAGVIGTHLTHGGTHFSTIGALVRAIHTDQKSNILLNPKIITEDNNTAEIFVGGTDRYKTQSITNDLGSLVTNNFQFIDVGTTLRVTPLIGNDGIITLDIIQETTAAAPGANSPLFTNNQDVNLVEVLTKTRSVTKVHVPDGFFVILSGMISDRESRSFSRIPCLGGIPLLGAACKRQDNSDDKRNLMLFIRPLIVDTEEDLEDITRRQQDVYNEKCKFRRSWNYEIDEGLNFLNVKPTDPDEIGCTE